MRRLKVDNKVIKVCRITYVGEPGYELHAPSGNCSEILKNLLTLKPDLTFAGSDAMNSMSMERGFVHWHSDVNSVDTAVEAG
jgi:sarcosine dehydrogenase